jgi:hypothetical protein
VTELFCRVLLLRINMIDFCLNMCTMATSLIYERPSIFA